MSTSDIKVGDVVQRTQGSYGGMSKGDVGKVLEVHPPLNFRYTTHYSIEGFSLQHSKNSLEVLK